MNTFELMPELDRVKDILDSWSITATDIANTGEMHRETARKCINGNDNVSIKTYKKFLELSKGVIEDRRETYLRLK